MLVWHSERYSNMKDTDIRKYAELMKELELTGLEITEDNKVVRLERSISVAGQPSIPPAVSIPSAQMPDCNADCIAVRSPIVGVFYAAPTENGEPYVTVGAPVKAGQTLCIVEAMKLMNEITAEADGVIAEILVTNGQMVEYGTELFRIRRC